MRWFGYCLGSAEGHRKRPGKAVWSVSCQGAKVEGRGNAEAGLFKYLRPVDQSYIITSFHYPDHPNFDFNRFYELLNDKGFIIYPGKVSDAACFRIGTIGRIFTDDVLALLAAIRETLTEMEVTL